MAEQEARRDEEVRQVWLRKGIYRNRPAHTRQQVMMGRTESPAGEGADDLDLRCS